MAMSEEKRSLVTLELRAEVVWRTGPDGIRVERIELRDCIMLAPAAAELLALQRAGETPDTLH